MQRRQSPITGQTSLLSSQSLPSCVGEEGEAMAAILEFKRTPCRGSFSEEFLSLVGCCAFGSCRVPLDWTSVWRVHFAVGPSATGFCGLFFPVGEVLPWVRPFPFPSQLMGVRPILLSYLMGQLGTGAASFERGESHRGLEGLLLAQVPSLLASLRHSGLPSLQFEPCTEGQLEQFSFFRPC